MLACLLGVTGCATPQKQAAVSYPISPDGQPSGVAYDPGPAPDAPPVPSDAEIVMSEGMVVSASTPEGKIVVTAGPGLLRTISWDGTKRYVVMNPRTERLYGSKGIYFEGRPTDWRTHKGINRIKYEEAERTFANIDDAKIWMQIRRLHYVYTNDGLVIGWKRKRGEGTLQVEVWQFLVDGSKPTLLPGSKDYLIQIRQAPVRTSER